MHSITKDGRCRCCKCKAEGMQKKRYRTKLLAIEYKGGKCERCGYDKCPEALEFHHLDPNKKEFTIARDGCNKTIEEMKKELDKCILLCSNCHKEVHFENRGGDLSNYSLQEEIKQIVL